VNERRVVSLIRENSAVLHKEYKMAKVKQAKVKKGTGFGSWVPTFFLSRIIIKHK
jgi:hypothetical protein